MCVFIMHRVILLIFNFMAVICQVFSFDNNKSAGSNVGSKSYRILPNTTEQLDDLISIKHFYGADDDDEHKQLFFPRDSSQVGEVTDVIVKSSSIKQFESVMKSYNLGYMIEIEDVEKLIQEEAEQTAWQSKRLADDTGLRGRQYDYFYDETRHHGYDEMVDYMHYLEWRYFYLAHVINLGKTFEGRIIKTIKISYPINDTKKRAIWIDAGTHAREWVSHSTAMYFIKLLTTNYDSDPLIKQLVTNFTWYITPNMNPDGYEFSRKERSIEVRLWRKNRAKRERFCKKGRCCIGVDLNRNYDFYWNDWRSARHPCMEDFRGPYPFSENETIALRNFMRFHADEIDAYITLHTYAQYWLYPYGHRQNAYPADVNDLREVAVNATKALSEKYGTEYRIGSGADLLYSASGGSEDWMKAKMNVKYSFLLELRPKENTYAGFLVNVQQLKPIAEETWEGVKVVANAVWALNEAKNVGKR